LNSNWFCTHGGKSLRSDELPLVQFIFSDSRAKCEEYVST